MKITNRDSWSRSNSLNTTPVIDLAWRFFSCFLRLHPGIVDRCSLRQRLVYSVTLHLTHWPHSGNCDSLGGGACNSVSTGEGRRALILPDLTLTGLHLLASDGVLSGRVLSRVRCPACTPQEFPANSSAAVNGGRHGGGSAR
ncbi:hypothetical protein E2C01_025153 [Portunus trituberculatus]|uniref:Uncharacterized protein n=1 Tax=Portunus trituberculatus TaxID=210409 RepID=A0A5B7EFS5_PORTR|nr:hypothetical protein [Portunus trituberculatus]